MLLQLLYMILGLMAARILFEVASVAYRTRSAYNKFLKESKGLVVVPGYSSLGGHLLTWPNRTVDIFSNLHKKYGNKFAWFYGSQPAISTTDLDLIKSIVSDEIQGMNRSQLNLPFEEFETDSITTSFDDQWKRLRRAIAPAFATHKVKSPEVLSEISATVAKFIEALDSKLRRAEIQRNEGWLVVDAEDVFHRYSLAAALTCLYRQDNLVDFYSAKDHWQNNIREGMRSLCSRIVDYCKVFPLVRSMVEYLILNFHIQGVMRQQVMDFIKKQTLANLEAKKILKSTNSSTKRDYITLKDGSRYVRNLVDFIVDQFHGGNLTEREYFHSTASLLYASNTTSADTISKLVYHLAMHPEIQIKLRNSILKDGEESEYLSWCINESQRLFPPTPLGCSRRLGKAIKCSDGTVIPAKTLVLTPLWTIHRSEEIWGEDALEFNPERWANAKDFHPLQFMPFGAGKRICLGKDLALLVIKMLMRELVPKYEFEYVPGNNDAMLFDSPGMTLNIYSGETNIKISRFRDEAKMHTSL